MTGSAVACRTTVATFGGRLSSTQTAATSVMCEKFARLVAAVVEHGAFAVRTGVAGFEVQMQELGLLTSRMRALLRQDTALR
jgi:hypothetical protein